MTDAARYGQLSGAGVGKEGSVTAETKAAPIATPAVATSLIGARFTRAFQLACSSAPNRIASKTPPVIELLV
jgi:hypothetical protein